MSDTIKKIEIYILLLHDAISGRITLDRFQIAAISALFGTIEVELSALLEQNKGLTFRIAENIKHIDAQRDGRTELESALRLILPMAKGYAALHRAGSNAEYIDQAERLIIPITEESINDY